MKTALLRSIFLAVLFAAAARSQTPFDRWEKEISAFEAADTTNAPPQNGIVFVGSSSIRMWKTLTADFPDLPVINRGFGGSQTIDSVHFADRIVIPYKPRLVVLYAGANDIWAKKSPEQVRDDFRAFVARVHEALPKTKIAFISIAPNPSRWSKINEIREANRLVQEEISKNPAQLEYINVFDAMLGPDGMPKPDIYLQDKLHMNASGYAIWKKIVRPYLDRAMASARGVTLSARPKDGSRASTARAN